MLWLLATSAILARPQAPVVQVQATVRIERPARASREAWDRAGRSQQREVIIKSEAGNPLRLRLVEYQ
jgi:hypothetical protein